jgi:hypothetical protein
MVERCWHPTMRRSKVWRMRWAASSWIASYTTQSSWKVVHRGKTAGFGAYRWKRERVKVGKTD